MKKLLAILLAAMMVFALAACGDNNTTDPDKDNPGVSQSGENNNDESTDNSGESNNNGDSPSNGNEWPDDKFTTHVPKPSFASYVSCSEKSAADGYILGQYGFSLEDEVNMDDVRAYVEELKNAGFTDSVTTTDTSVSFYFAAKNPTTNVSVTLTVYPDSNPIMRTLQIYIPG